MFRKEAVEKSGKAPTPEGVYLDPSLIPAPDRNYRGAKKMKDFSDGKKWFNTCMVILSIIIGFLLWWLLSATVEKVHYFLSTPAEVWQAFVARAITKNWYWTDVGTSLTRVLVGYSLAFVVSIPVAFLMAWYRPARNALDPWIQFFRTIPPIATIPIMIVAFGGTGEPPKYAIIFIAVFLTMTVTIFQGIRNIDLTLVKAAYTFGAKDRNLFLDVIVPDSFPFILTAMRLGVGAALTTLIAAEMTGATDGLGAMIMNASGNNRIDIVIMGIISIGIIGFTFDRLLLILEKILTRWK
jgi:NitT/TauT family transport system permease protein